MPSVLSSTSNELGHSQPTLTFHIPSYGVLYVPHPHPRPYPAPPPLPPTELQGELEVVIPPELGSCRIKGLDVVLRTVCMLTGAGDEGIEMHRLEKGLVGEGILGIGSHRYAFTLHLPPDLMPHDWHPEGRIRHILEAKLQGYGPNPRPSNKHNTSSWKDRFRSRSPTPSPSHTPRRNLSPIATPSRSPSPVSHNPLSRGLGGGQSLSFDTLAEALPTLPTYGEVQEEIPRLQGVYKTERTIKICLNPCPDSSGHGGISSFDVRIDNYVDGLGVYELNFWADPWVVCSVLHTSLKFTSLNPSATIYKIQTLLCQTVTILPPSDAKGGYKDSEPVVVSRNTRTYPVSELGEWHSEKGKGKAGASSALVEAGEEGGGWNVELKGRLPDDRKVRPSSLDGVKTPMHISHGINLEVYFSVKGQDAQGRSAPNARGGLGDVRLMMVKTDVILPACPLIGQVQNLPSYPTHSNETYSTPNTPCPLCQTTPDNRLCVTCPPSTPPHPRHDHPPKLVGSEDGVCPLCSRDGRIMPSENEVGWRNCACGLKDEELEVVTRRVNTERERDLIRGRQGKV